MLPYVKKIPAAYPGQRASGTGATYWFPKGSEKALKIPGKPPPETGGFFETRDLEPLFFESPQPQKCGPD